LQFLAIVLFLEFSADAELEPTAKLMSSAPDLLACA
jgi:hypothetical protein